MPRLPALTPESAQGKARDLLAALVSRHGEVGLMVRSMANSPAVLTGYLELSRAMKRAKLDRRVSERISIAVQQRLGCASCLAAHIDAARQHGVDDEEIARAQAGTSSHPAVAAIVAFGLQVLSEPAAIDDETIARLRSHGYSDRVIADVVGVVALNVLTGAFNLVAAV